MSKVYRIYQPYHESSESGTYEYGIYSSKERVKRRLLQLYKELVKEKGWENVVLHWEGLYIKIQGWDSYEYIWVRKYELDRDIEDDVCGYT